MHNDEHERTMAFAEIALGQIKALRQPASPRNYEIWYTYATGYNPAFNQAINETLALKGALSEVDLDQIYETHLSPTRITDRIDSVGAQVLDEIEEVMTVIGHAVGSATSYTESLSAVTQKLGHAKDRDALRGIVEKLVTTTREMERSNQSLEERLLASKQEINQLQENLEAVRTESLTDPLTALNNRKYFDQALHEAVSERDALQEPLALLMADVDHFKMFNDKYGHLTGDQALRLVAAAIKQNLKAQDIAARYGGEEFAIILPGIGLAQAVAIADNIRRGVMTKELLKRSTGEQLGRMTLSIGVALLRGGETAQMLMERADACLYAAKRGGRNRVISETDPELSRAPLATQVA